MLILCAWCRRHCKTCIEDDKPFTAEEKLHGRSRKIIASHLSTSVHAYPPNNTHWLIPWHTKSGVNYVTDREWNQINPEFPVEIRDGS
jgi:hypothetical protein